MTIDWQMEADRANRLYAGASRCVEKLNADLKLAKEQRNEGGEIILKLVARIEQLEAALRDIATAPVRFDDGSLGKIDVPYGRGIIKGLESSAEIASAALAPEQDIGCGKSVIEPWNAP